MHRAARTSCWSKRWIGSYANLMARRLRAIRAVTCRTGWGGSSSVPSSVETAFDSHFTNPGVSYFAASGDSGCRQASRRASPKCISLAAPRCIRHRLRVEPESAWSSSGGGMQWLRTRPLPNLDLASTPVAVHGNGAHTDVALDPIPTRPQLHTDGTIPTWSSPKSAPTASSLYNDAGATDIIVDVRGWFPLTPKQRETQLVNESVSASKPRRAPASERHRGVPCIPASLRRVYRSAQPRRSRHSDHARQRARVALHRSDPVIRSR